MCFLLETYNDFFALAFLLVHCSCLNLFLIIESKVKKSFLTLLTEELAENRDIETVAISQYLAKKEIHYLRIHNVEATARGIKTFSVF